ncbi:MAG: YfiR family protein [Magnetococcus sp. YQC-5]
MRSWYSYVALLLMMGTGWKACADQPSEYQVKGAYLYHFTKFVTWPPSAFANEQAPFRLCVMGENPFGAVLDALTKKTTNNRSISLAYPETGQQATTCHLLFIAVSEQEKWSAILSAIQGKPVLTVGDRPDFVQQGGMIHFVPVQDTLRFAINQENARAAGLKISATLLQVGHVIK